MATLLSPLPTLAGLSPGQTPPTPSAGGSTLGDVPLPSGTPTSLGALGTSLSGLGTSMSGGLTSLLGLSGSLVSPITQGTTGTTGNTSAVDLTNITPDGFIARIAYILLGVVVIAGAIYTYKK